METPLSWKDRNSLGWNVVLFIRRQPLVRYSLWSLALLSGWFSLTRHHGGPIAREVVTGKYSSFLLVQVREVGRAALEKS